MTDIDFDRLEELTGLPLLPWQREAIELSMRNPRGWIVVAGSRRGWRSSMAALEILLREPWRLPDRPRWPRHQLVRLPARLEQALDLLIDRRRTHARTR